MSIPDDLRRAYSEQAGLTEQALQESIGEVTVAPANVRAQARAAGLTRAESDAEPVPDAESAAARDAVARLMADVTILQAKYNKISADNGDRDAREFANADELATDRRFLEEMIADEYRLTNPFGKSEGKDQTINKILSGTIRMDSFGRDGFEALETEVQVLGSGTPETVILYGTFFMRGSGLADYSSGATDWQDLTGRYRTTHSFVYRDGRWQETTAQMTHSPPDGPGFDFVGERA